MDIHQHALDFVHEIAGNVYVTLLSTEPEQVRNTIFWAFPKITEVDIGNSKYFAQYGEIYNATIDFNSNRVIMVKK